MPNLKKNFGSGYSKIHFCFFIIETHSSLNCPVGDKIPTETDFLLIINGTFASKINVTARGIRLSEKLQLTAAL